MAGALTVEAVTRFRGGSAEAPLPVDTGDPIDTGGLQAPVPSDAPGARIWRTGDAFVLRCPIDAPVVAVLFHVDPEGRIALLHPETADGPFPLASAEGPLELPPPESGIQWFLEGRPGTETFLLAFAEEARDFAGVLSAVIGETGASEESDAGRAEVVDQLRDLLERQIGTVRVTEIDHVD